MDDEKYNPSKKIDRNIHMHKLVALDLDGIMNSNIFQYYHLILLSYSTIFSQKMDQKILRCMYVREDNKILQSSGGYRMKIFETKDGLQVVKPNKTSVLYYLFEHYEVHYNEISPYSEQEWHRHAYITELLFVIGGSLELLWVDEKGKHCQTVQAKALIDMEDCFHTIKNTTKNVASFLVMKINFDSEYAELLKKDKIFMEEI